MPRSQTYVTVTALLVGSLLLWRSIHDVWFIGETRAQWDGQTLPQHWKGTLLWVHLSLQISIGAGLWAGIAWRPLRPYALGAAVLMFAVYTVYSELALLERLPRKPCACIGWWDGITWPWLVGANALLFLAVLIPLMQDVVERRKPMT